IMLQPSVYGLRIHLSMSCDRGWQVHELWRWSSSILLWLVAKWSTMLRMHGIGPSNDHFSMCSYFDVLRKRRWRAAPRSFGKDICYAPSDENGPIGISNNLN